MERHPNQCRALRAALVALLAVACACPAAAAPDVSFDRNCPRVGALPAGPLDAITDVAGVKVGQVTLEQGTTVHTGVTAILPHGGNLFRSKVPAGLFVANGFGKFAGATQVEELGEVETPILLTNTLSVPEAMAAAIEWTLAQPGNDDVRSVNAVVGETNDGRLNDIRGRHVTIADARRAIEMANAGPVAEGAVGAGTGTVAFGWKGGIGTASRRLAAPQGGWTIGVLVQANYGGTLTIAGRSIASLPAATLNEAAHRGDGSVVIVIATDAPLSDRNLERLAARSFAGIARTGSNFANGSGDYAIAFSTNPAVRRPAAAEPVAEITNDAMTPLFEAVADATEQGVYRALLAAHAVDGFHGRVEAVPRAEVMRALGCERVP